MTKKPLAVGLTMERRDFPIAPLVWCAETTIDPFVRAGCLPLLLPNPLDAEIVTSWLDGLDALVLTDGVPPASFLYGENPASVHHRSESRRDAAETLLYRLARKRNLPVLGIGRGMQMIQVLQGGKLLQNLAASEASLGAHGADDVEPIRHFVTTKPGSFANRAVGDRAVVPSRHRCGIQMPAPGFIVTAKADDGVAEAIESEEGAPVFGVQWPFTDPDIADRMVRAFLEEIA